MRRGGRICGKGRRFFLFPCGQGVFFRVLLRGVLCGNVHAEGREARTEHVGHARAAFLEGGAEKEQQGCLIGPYAGAAAPDLPEGRALRKSLDEGRGLKGSRVFLPGGMEQIDEEKPRFEKFRVPGESCAQYVQRFGTAAVFHEQAGIGKKDTGSGVEREHFLIPERLFGTGIFRQGRIHG